MFYTIYKTTNLINGKVYIGKHKTKDPYDKYLGSGKNFSNAEKKYGTENFKKEVLFIFDTEDEMDAKEAELVTEEFVKEDTNYNMIPGGKGGWGYVNMTEHRTSGHSPEMYRKISFKLKGRAPSEACIVATKQSHKEGNHKYDNFRGKTHSKETKLRIGISNSKRLGKETSQFGTMWITDGLRNKKIKSDDLIPEGWYKGRIIKPK